MQKKLQRQLVSMCVTRLALPAQQQLQVPAVRVVSGQMPS